MNKRGFTLVELLATIVILGIVVGLTVIISSGVFKNAKERSEEIFVNTITNALDVYIDDKTVKKYKYTDEVCTLVKAHGSVKVYKYPADLTFNNVINSEYSPLSQNDLVNPANKGVACNNATDIPVQLYRDSDYVYYYKVDRDNFGCLKSGIITNLPSGCNG